MQIPIDCDRTGFPLLWIDQLGAHLHWLPVTKLQFEMFLCDPENRSFDDPWYRQVLALNPRLTPSDVRPENYWQALMTGVLPDEARRFAAWCGENYSLPGPEEWRIAYRAVSAQTPLKPELLERLPKLSERARLLVRNLDAATESAAHEGRRQRTLGEQMLMRLGALEWVEQAAGEARWLGLGELPQAFGKILASPDLPVTPPRADSLRSEYFGFRLLRRST